MYYIAIAETVTWRDAGILTVTLDKHDPQETKDGEGDEREQLEEARGASAGIRPELADWKYGERGAQGVGRGAAWRAQFPRGGQQGVVEARQACKAVI